MVFYRDTKVFAARKGPFKAHFITRSAYGGDKAIAHDPPLLFHLEHDPSEKEDIAKDHLDIIADIRKLVEAHEANMKAGTDQLGPKIQKAPAMAQWRDWWQTCLGPCSQELGAWD
jgi:hypothetical protein